MLRILLPVILAMAGLGGGVAAGKMLRPPALPDTLADPCGDLQIPQLEDSHITQDEADHASEAREYVKMNNQFIIPDIEDGKVAALVVMSITVEITSGGQEAIFQREPRLRNAFLQVLFDHANAGGFKGAFTESRTMSSLRRALREAGQNISGSVITDVLITDIVRQDTT